MAPRTTHLRETETAAASSAEVIDAKFTVVATRKRSGWFRHVLMFLFALVCAAAIGFLIPPAWLVLQNMAALFSQAP
jgi:hypothetical protein